MDLLTPTRAVRLANGMRVLSRRLNHAPVVCSMVWYGVGSRNEQAGQTGISHFLEHMMFKGTPRFPYGELEEGVKARGGMWNAFTSYDYTAYYEVLPARHLEYGLQVEADRMVHMAFDPDLTVRERGIIVSEREGRENSPYFWLFDAFMHEAYRQFPYRHPILGYKEDIRATTAEALTAHYKRFYRPNNATLVVAGDLDEDRLLALAEKHFGSLQPGPDILPLPLTEPEQTEERRVVVRRPGPNPYLMMGYKIPGSDHPDHAALTVMAAVLAGGPSFGGGGAGSGMGRSSRLYRSLVTKGLATSASGYPLSLQHLGLFIFSAIPVRGVGLERLEKAVTAEAERLGQETVPEEELARAKKQVRAQFLYGMEGVMNQATLLGSIALTQGVEHFDAALEEYDAVTAEDLRRVAQTYLQPGRRTVGWFQPEEAPAAGTASESAPATSSPNDSTSPSGQTPQPGRPSAEGEELTDATTPAYQRRGAAPAPAVLSLDQPGAPARIIRPEQVMREALPGGATLLVYPVRTLPSIFVRVQLEAGSIYDPEGKDGLAQLTAQTVSRASRSFTAEELAQRTDALGISLRVESGRETAVGSLKCLPEDLETGLGFLSELLTAPAFPQDELERLRERMLVSVREANNDTRSIAARRLGEMLYPEGHPYRRAGNGTEQSLAAISREDLVAFHRRHYRPTGGVVTVVGDVEPERIHRALLRSWEGWSGGPGRQAIPAVPLPAGGRHHCTVEGKSLTDLAMGWPLVDRAHPHYLALSFLATILGGNGTPASSRLFRNVRERFGVSYYQFASFGASSGPAAWTVHIGVNPSRLAFTLEQVTAELRRLTTEPIPGEELRTLKAFLTDYPAVQHESAERLAARLGEIERHSLGLDYFERQAALTQALTAQHLQAVAKRYLDLDRISVVTAGPAPRTD